MAYTRFSLFGAEKVFKWLNGDERFHCETIAETRDYLNGQLGAVDLPMFVHLYGNRGDGDSVNLCAFSDYTGTNLYADTDGLTPAEIDEIIADLDSQAFKDTASHSPL